MEYEPVIALEVHAQIKTRSKQYCKCIAVNTRELAEANKYICPVCLGHPGVLPVLNEESVILAMAFGMRLGGEIARQSIFARKHYFYPDLPKGYQITQYQTPLISGGKLEYWHEGVVKRAPLQRSHLEEDTAKIFYQTDGGVLLDYNRSGIPLLEIVTQPCFKSASEAVAFADELRKVLQELNVSEASMEDGSFRCEPNISVRPLGSSELRTKTEVKNLNSFATMRKALESEIARQTAIYRSDQAVRHCTMRWDEAQGQTIPMRSKETQADYRYFDEPDLPPLILVEAQFIEAKRRFEGAFTELSYKGKAIRFYAGTAALTEFLVREIGIREDEALILVDDRSSLALILAAVKLGSPLRECANLVLNDYRPKAVSKPGLITPQHIADLAEAKYAGKLASSQLREVLASCFETGLPVAETITRLGHDQQVSESDLSKASAEVIAANEKAVNDIRKGKSAALQVLVGQVMRVTKGKANPESVLAELKRQLGL